MGGNASSEKLWHSREERGPPSALDRVDRLGREALPFQWSRRRSIRASDASSRSSPPASVMPTNLSSAPRRSPRGGAESVDADGGRVAPVPEQEKPAQAPKKAIVEPPRDLPPARETEKKGQNSPGGLERR
jgi:hypothetical protein